MVVHDQGWRLLSVGDDKDETGKMHRRRSSFKITYRGGGNLKLTWCGRVRLERGGRDWEQGDLALLRQRPFSKGKNHRRHEVDHGRINKKAVVSRF